MLEERGSEVKVDVGILQVVVLVLGFLNSSGLSLFMGGGVLPLVLADGCIWCVENALAQLDLAMAYPEDGLAGYTTGPWSCRRMKTQRFPEQVLCIRDEPLVKVPAGLVLEQDVLQPVGEGIIPMKSTHKTLVKTFVYFCTLHALHKAALLDQFLTEY